MMKKSHLTQKAAARSLQNVPGSQATGRNIKHTYGGKVQDTQPLAMSGFFMPATLLGDDTNLPGVARNRIPFGGNTCSVSVRTLNGSRQPYNCQNIKQTCETITMIRDDHAIGTPAPFFVAFYQSTNCSAPSPYLKLPLILSDHNMTAIKESQL
jgi:hypothetical protein